MARKKVNFSDTPWIKPEAEESYAKLQEGIVDLLEETGLHTKCYRSDQWDTDVNPDLSVDKYEEMCYGCPLIKLCYDFAVANDEQQGVWGGVNFDVTQNDLFDMEEYI
jgi:hypothetical protein